MRLFKKKNSPKKIIKEYLKKSKIGYIREVPGSEMFELDSPGCDSILVVGLKKK